MSKMSLNLHGNTRLPLPKDQVCLQEITSLTVIAVVVHQDDFFEQVCRSVIDSRVDRAQYHGQSLVDEDEDEGDLRQVSRIADLPAPAEQRKHSTR